MTPSFATTAPAAGGIALMVSRHAEEAATSWWRRGSAYLDDPRTHFLTLARYDETIDAHLDGLLIAGRLGLDVVERALAGDAPDTAADIFAALALAILSQDAALVEHMLARSDALPGKAWALEGVFAWLDSEHVKALVDAHLTSPNPRYRDAALAQCHTHRLTGGAVLAALLNGSESELLARALRSAGECGRVDLLPQVRAWLDPARQCEAGARHWAAWSATLLGGLLDDAAGVLQACVEQGGKHQRDSLLLLCLAMPPERLLPYLHTLSSCALDPLLFVEAVGLSGHPGYADWLIVQMRDPALAMVAGEAFRCITGFDLESNYAESDPPPTASEAEDAAPEPAYPYPDADRVSAWWQQHQTAYAGAGKLFLGRPVTLAWLDEILDQGEQRHREIAALYRVLLRPGSMLLPTRAHSATQWLRLRELQAA